MRISRSVREQISASREDAADISVGPNNDRGAGSYERILEDRMSSDGMKHIVSSLMEYSQSK
jgi:hypothetical protein